MGGLWLALVLGAPVLLVALLLGLFLHPLAGLGAALLIALLISLWIRAQAGSGLRRAGARPLEASEAPRLLNLARGMATDLGVEAPTLWIVEGGGPNAVIGRAGTPAIAVTRSLLDDYTRTELEAVLAHCLLRLEPTMLRKATLSGALGETAGPAGALDLTDVDARAVALTRYPPALASAIAKAEPRPGREGAFWFVPEGSRFGTQETRATSIGDL